MQSPFPYLIKVIAEQLLEPRKQKYWHQKHVHLCERELLKPFVFLLHNRTDNPQNIITTGKRNRNALLRTAVQHSCVCSSVGECECLVLWLFIFKTKKTRYQCCHYHFYFTTVLNSSICKHYSKYTTWLSFSVNIDLCRVESEKYVQLSKLVMLPFKESNWGTNSAVFRFRWQQINCV